MTIEEIQSICKSYAGVTEDIKWENHLCFNVVGKMFLVTAPDSVPVSASIKVTQEDFELLPQREGIIPAPYMARYKWVYLDDINLFSKAEWEQYLKLAYNEVINKLTAKAKREINER